MMMMYDDARTVSRAAGEDGGVNGYSLLVIGTAAAGFARGISNLKFQI
jgi:hypothetical protein